VKEGAQMVSTTAQVAKLVMTIPVPVVRVRQVGAIMSLLVGVDHAVDLNNLLRSRSRSGSSSR
jgi:hypothetical protein